MLTVKQKEINKSASLAIELAKFGGHYGYSRSRRHPSAEPFIFGFKNRAAIIDLEKTADALERALGLVEDLGRESKTILLVGTKPEARTAIREAGFRLNLPFVALRWIGGTLTNFSEIRKRVDRLEELSVAREKGGLDGRTKKEKLLVDREIAKLDRFFSNLKTLTKLPAALLVIDSAAETTAVAEARKLKIPVIGFASTDCDISQLDYPVVVNESSLAIVKFLIGRVMESYEIGRAKGPATPPEVKS